MNDRMTVCRSKTFYDSEWEATLAANRAEDKFGDEMVPYRCGAHYHITHRNPAQRRGAGHRYDKCEDCGAIVKSSKMSRHKCKGWR